MKYPPTARTPHTRAPQWRATLPPRAVYPLGPGLRRAIHEHEATIYAAEGREPVVVRRAPAKTA